MGLLQSLRRGVPGVRFTVPDDMEVHADEERSATIHDRARSAVLFLFHSDKHLDLRHQGLLREDIERHTRDLFERCFRSEPSPGTHSTPPAPRTQDHAWSPVVDVIPVRIGGADALTVVHRCWYQPGHEALMGHLLIPLASGLLEVRIVPREAAITGLRESVLCVNALNEARDESEEAVMRRLGQAVWDDPRHDVEFPDHPLSLTRRWLRWLIEDAGIEVLEPQCEPTEGEQTFSSAGFALTPPPRYLPIDSPPSDGLGARWSRVSFSGTDGVQLLSVKLLATSLPRPDSATLTKLADEVTRRGAGEGMTEYQWSTRSLPDDEKRFHAESYRTYVEDGAPQHTVLRWFAEKDGRIVMVALGAAKCVPAEELASDAAAVVDSFRFLGGPSKRRSWWRR